MMSSSQLIAPFGKDSGNPRKQHAFEVVEEIPEDDDDTYLDEDFSENDGPYIDEDGNFLANEQIVSDIDDDLALDDEEYHEALLGYREARDLMKEARVARGFYPVVVPIRSDHPTSVSRGRGRKGKSRGRSGARDGPSSSQACFKCGSNDHWARDCPKMDDGSSNPKKRNLGAYAYGTWTCNNPDNSRDESVPQTRFRWIPCVVLRFLLSKTTMSVKLMLHFWWNLKVSVFWTVVQPLRLVALRALKPCSPRVMNMILEFQKLIHLEVDHSTLEMVLHQRLLPCPDSQCEMMLLVISGSLRICSWISQNRLR